MKPIIALGSVNADLVVAAAKAPDAGETVAGQDFHIFPGGKGANQAVAASLLLPGKVGFIGMVGDDVFASMLRNSLQQAGVSTEGLHTCKGPSGVAVITVESSGQNRIIVVPGANGEVTETFVSEQAQYLEDTQLLLLQLEIPLTAVERAARLADGRGAAVILDPAPVPTQPLPAALLQHVSWLTPNYTEACLLTGRPPSSDPVANTDALLDALLDLGAEHILLKLGEHGAAIAMRSGERRFVPAFHINVVDTTAAGDAFNGGFAAALVKGKEPVAAAHYASAVAALAVTRWGAQTSMPTLGEVEAFLSEQGVLLSSDHEVQP